MQAALGRDSFWQCCIRIAFSKQELALQVAGLDEVAVNDCQPPDPCPGERLGLYAAQRAATDDHRVRPLQINLSDIAQPVKPDLARVSASAVRTHRCRSSH